MAPMQGVAKGSGTDPETVSKTSITGSLVVNWKFALPPDLAKKNLANRVSKNRRSPMIESAWVKLVTTSSGLAWTREIIASDNIKKRAAKWFLEAQSFMRHMVFCLKIIAGVPGKSAARR